MRRDAKDFLKTTEGSKSMPVYEARHSCRNVFAPRHRKIHHPLESVMSLAKPRSTTGCNLASLRLAPLHPDKFIFYDALEKNRQTCSCS